MQALPKLGWPPHPVFQASWAIWPIISRKCDSRQFSTKVRKSFLRVKMLNRCGFWGKKGHFCGEIITFGWWMITFEGPQCMWTNPSQKSRQGSDPPPIQAMPVFWELLVRHSIPKWVTKEGLEPARATNYMKYISMLGDSRSRIT